MNGAEWFALLFGIAFVAALGLLIWDIWEGEP